ncbi:MAG: hypothetical protein SV775_17090, partial [Thermodesulfobacteriota bacterium]|nr:hypothetical protein [Thermodesulfobacteriota bacterium]
IEDSDLSHVVCTIWYVDDQVDPDIQGAVMKAITYTYTLFKYGSEITGGEWTGSSVLNRPEQLVLPILQGTDNTYLDYDFIRDLAVSRDDYLESDQPVELPPGGYNLILINEDIYTISCDVGDEVLLSFEKTDDLEEGIQVSVTDGNGAPVFSGIVEATEEVNFTADNPPYTIALSRNDFGGGGVYRLECDLKMAFEFANTKIQKGFGWGGFAITNTRETDCDKVFLVGYTEDGRPMETYIGPISLQPGEKRTVLISDLEVRSVEKNDLFGVKVHAPLDLSVISLTGYFEGNMSCYNGMERRSLLIIPDISSWLDFSRSVSWGLYNPITATSSVQMRLFSSEGVLKDEAGLFIPANSSLHYNSSISPFSGYGDGGWILVEGDGTPGLKGYVEWLENGIYKAEALYPLKPGTDFFMPVTAIETVPWGAKVTLINVADVVNEVAFMLIGGGGINEALVSFNPGEKKVLNMEELFSPVDLQTISESSLRIHSSLDAAGFYILETSADDAYFPLLNYENVSQELVLPHVSSDDYWWTAVNLANASSRPVGFSILPYDEYGEPMEEHSIKRLIMPRRKRIFDVSRLFGSVAGEISFVKFRTWMGPGIAGVFVYGNHDYSMLSGGVLKSPMPPHPGPLPQRGEGIN